MKKPHHDDSNLGYLAFVLLLMFIFGGAFYIILVAFPRFDRINHQRILEGKKEITLTEYFTGFDENAHADPFQAD